MGRLSLDPRPNPKLRKTPDQPLGSPPLTLGSRRPIDPLEFLEPAPQSIFAHGHRRNLYGGAGVGPKRLVLFGAGLGRQPIRKFTERVK